MDYNIANGGLLVKLGNSMIVSNMNSYRTFSMASPLDGMFWFMNCNEDSIFFSEQMRKHSLCKMDLDTGIVTVILDKPCSEIRLSKTWLYYINENDRKLYRCFLNGKNESKIIDEPVCRFILDNEKIIYSSESGIKLCNSETGEMIKKLSEVRAINLLLLGRNLFFANADNKYFLTMLNLNDGSIQEMEGIAPLNLNTDGRYLYCIDRLNDRNIFRIEAEQASVLRICSESAEYLHIIEDRLYFCIDREWQSMSLSGGSFDKI